MRLSFAILLIGLAGLAAGLIAIAVGLGFWSTVLTVVLVIWTLQACYLGVVLWLVLRKKRKSSGSDGL